MTNTVAQCVLLAKAIGRDFSLRGNNLTHEEVFSEMGLLPGIAKRADQLCSLCLGYGIGVTFEKEEKSTLGYKVIFDEDEDRVIRLLCILDIIKDIADANPSGPVPLDEILYD
ncbi:MAG TPA: type IV secretion IcmS family protein [Gammaproteobacteria bacterium]|nr:type IV secretion IcmS family protein [Gammaproteobacteria bacterium]